MVDTNPVDIDGAWTIGKGCNLVDVPNLREIATYGEVSNDEVGLRTKLFGKHCISGQFMV